MLKFEIGVKTLKVSQVVVDEVMPTKRRSRKRNRSSPQVPSASKKHQSLKSAVACDLQEADESLETNTQTETESADIVKQSGLGAESDMNVTIDSTMAEVTSTPISTLLPDSPDQPSPSQIQSQSLISNQGQGPPNCTLAPISQSHGSVNIIPHFIGPAPFLDANLLAASPHISGSQNVLPLPPSSFRLSDEDVLRIAQQTKAIIREDVEQIVIARVAAETDKLRKEIHELKQSVTRLQEELNTVQIRSDDFEQYSRRSCVRISGIAETANEDVTKIVLELANHVKADIMPSDIDRAHRVGRRGTMIDSATANANVSPKREIIVKFTNSSACLKVLKGRAQLRSEKSRVFINEDITQSRKLVAFECRGLRKANLIKKTWVYAGKIYIQDNNDKKLRIDTVKDVEAFRVDALNKKR